MKVEIVTKRLEDALATSDKTFEPVMSAAQRDELYSGWLRAVERAKGWASDD